MNGTGDLFSALAGQAPALVVMAAMLRWLLMRIEKVESAHRDERKEWRENAEQERREARASAEEWRRVVEASTAQSARSEAALIRAEEILRRHNGAAPL